MATTPRKTTAAKKAPAKKAVPRSPGTGRPTKPKVAPAVESWLKTLTLDEADSVHAALARSLAVALDEASGSESGAMAMATAGIAKELRAVVDAILEAAEDDGGFVAGLFEETPGSG